MITLSNGHESEYFVASGALGFKGKGYWWERPLVWLGLIKPELFTVVLKTLTLNPRKGNLSWWKPWTWFPWSPWSCVRLLPNDGAVNKVGLTNPGIDSWCEKVGPFLDYEKYKLVVSIFGTEAELVEMAKILNHFPFVAIEINVSCPNTEHPMGAAQIVIKSVKAVKKVSRHPVIVKLSVDQDYLAIARELEGFAEAIALNSVPWKVVFPMEKSPLEKIGPTGSGNGGVSGKPAQEQNWKAVKSLVGCDTIPVIAPSIMQYDDISKVRKLGAKAVSFGAIHLRTPWKPTSIVRKELR